MTTPEY